ncbi:Protein of unknown function [Pyronema omphalodes CBS 100304]|uniref:Uncharacterized protein n=1 Tax=Pyronema omphalodes (strain CBS 100304) TaxID=1076935 RepID=U4L0E3_PYROM|nr:Protein of unknown function [Pyronema omphalodes CBS 100304]
MKKIWQEEAGDIEGLDTCGYLRLSYGRAHCLGRKQHLMYTKREYVPQSRRCLHAIFHGLSFENLPTQCQPLSEIRGSSFPIFENVGINKCSLQKTTKELKPEKSTQEKHKPGIHPKKPVLNRTRHRAPCHLQLGTSAVSTHGLQAIHFDNKPTYGTSPFPSLPSVAGQDMVEMVLPSSSRQIWVVL